MYVMLAWFADRPISNAALNGHRDRALVALGKVVGDGYVRREYGEEDWGLVAMYPSAKGAWRWGTLAEDDTTIVVSMGIPVGLATADGPLALGLRLLNGEDVHAEVVPPFALMAMQRGRQFTVQQDWLGMCRLFRGTRDGITVFCTRPSIVSEFLWGTTKPDLGGWSAYAVSGHFGGELTPFDGVHQLQPGERINGVRHANGGWDLRDEVRFCLDDVVLAGINARADGPAASLDKAANDLLATATSAGQLYAGDMSLGLSGGKDSRLIAATLIAAGYQPKLHTNDDLPAEGEVAKRLVAIVRESRGLALEHRLQQISGRTSVETTGLNYRIRRLQALYDYQYPSNYSLRSPAPHRLPANMPALSFSGAGGELATGYWYPKGDGSDENSRLGATAALNARLLTLRLFASEHVAAKEDERIALLLDRGERIGLRGLELVDYVYLAERARKWCSSAYVVGTVTPFLSPSFVAATFALEPAHKRQKMIHLGLIERLMPEWREVPFVVGSAPNPNVARVWDGDGLRELHRLLDTTFGEIAHLLRRDQVGVALERVVRGPEGAARWHRLLLQFAYLAVASEVLEPEAVRAPTTDFEAYVQAVLKSPPNDGAAHRNPTSRSRWHGKAAALRKTRLGGMAWRLGRVAVVRWRRVLNWR